MAAPEKTPSLSAPDIRAIHLTDARFFSYHAVYEQVIFGEMPAGEDVVHGLAVDLEKNRLYCTCAFRPQPCVHASAFHQLFLRSGADFPMADVLPDWVQDLLSGTGGRSRPTPADPSAARQQRRYERLERAADGFEDLESWLLDVIRRGLATTVSEDSSFAPPISKEATADKSNWAAGMATRLADASLTGLSRTLRLTGILSSSDPDWAEKTLAVLAESYLAVRAFRKRDTLPESQIAELQQWLGISTKKEEVIAHGERLTDAWAVVGQLEETLEKKLKVRRTWLLGQSSRRYALLLDYTFGGEPFPPAWLPGTIQQGTIAWYPSSWPLRALVLDDFKYQSKIERLEAYDDFQAFASDYAQAVGVQPWMSVFPAIFSEAAIFFKNESLFAMDTAGKILKMQASENEIWRLLALSGGHAVSLFGEWDGMVFRPLTVVAAGRLVAL